ncbi:RagB/SusD family nutrient uptake outer membrane protein [Sphingobacterium alkalisoli]|uniref:RagB/SusD family nutrient uptake outer membrane protein n=1 Tax=Sphingobacterium alkalisoli TaxID=1874115 RepID=A0A4U0H1Q1_9SPHI|nr:RagB/SusD family nutrient uptake outer membrane protein [Sphingobacterium alkalisoli]TJY65505.1 RagB/SusD family nutrient uptake outer membrane protein [Sphingobacterium alkalisoli]GGH20057.1 membrane protein [Sphingobacterium alkalisoli]
MKNLTLYTIGSLLCFASCSKWLDKEPIGILTQEQVQVDPTEGTVVTGIDNAYRPLSYTLNLFGEWDWTGGLVIRPDFLLEDIAAGDATKKWTPDGDQAWMDDVANYNFTAENGAFAGIWKFNYEGISRCNMAIFQLTDPETVAKINMAEAKRTQLLAEASFLRAFFYFDLVKYFGDVPMVLQPLRDFNEAYEVAVKTPKAAVYEQIKADLQEAINGFPNAKYTNQSERWRASKGAAIALLAKVALFEGNWKEVVTQINTLDQLGFYDLNTNYFDAFDDTKTYIEKENIFIYDHEPGMQPIRGNGFTALMGWGFMAPSTNFLAAFESGDPRRTYTVNTNDQAIYKLLGAQNANYKGNDNSPVNRIYIRYADVVLWRAEALIKDNQVSAGVALINKVRERARAGNNSVLPDRNTSITDANLAMQWLQHERRVELGLESHRLSDLRRWNIAETTLIAMGKPFLKRHMLYPIPQTEVDKTVGKIAQNDGYNN